MTFFFRCFLLLSLCWVSESCTRDQSASDQLVNTASEPAADDAALRAANAAIEKEPGSAANLRRRAGIFLDREQYDLALTDIDRALALDSTKGEFYFVKARALRGQKNVPTALKTALKAEQKGYADAAMYTAMGEMFLILKQYQKAIDYLNKSLQLSQFNEQAYFYKGLVYAESGDTTRALSSLQTAVEMSPKYVDAYNALFRIHNARGEQKLAEQYISSGLRFAENDPFLWFNQGVLFSRAGKTDTAMASFRRAYLLDSTFYLASYNLGTLAYQKEQYNEAARHLQLAYRKNRNLDGIEALLAYSHEQLGNLQEAQRYYKEAAAEAPNDTEVQKGLARVEAQLKGSAAAKP